jgi:hypothetical protein
MAGTPDNGPRGDVVVRFTVYDQNDAILEETESASGKPVELAKLLRSPRLTTSQA